MNYCGIDNGVSGALALLRDDGSVELLATPTSTIGGSSYLDAAVLHDLLSDWARLPGFFVALEATQVQPIFGAKTNHSMGKSAGGYDMLLRVLKIKHTLVPPKVWQKEMLMGVRKAGQDTGLASIEACKRLFPNVSLVPPRGRKDSDGFADALLIAEWARRNRL